MSVVASVIKKRAGATRKRIRKNIGRAKKEMRVVKKEIRNARKEMRVVRKKMGPGVITGGADNDPAGIITYTMAGALYGYALLWVVVVCTPLMIAVQEMAGRLAIVKKKGISGIIKEHYGRKTSVIVTGLLVAANTATIGADIAGIAAVISMITGIHFLLLIFPIAAIISYIAIFQKYKVIKKMLLILTLFLGVYIVSALLSKPNWTAAAQGMIPAYIPAVGFIAAAIGIIGTTISPYMLFWQASEELEEKRTIEKVKDLEFDTKIGMLWSNIISAFIIIAAAATLYTAGMGVDSAQEAALALRPLAGEFAYLLFSFGIIAAGFLALPVLAGSTAYAVAGTFGWKEGINKKASKAKGFYLIFALSIAMGCMLALLPINPMHFLYYTQIANGFLTPFLVVVLLLLCNNKEVMGEYTNTKFTNAMGIILLIILGILDLMLVNEFIHILPF